MNEPERDEYFDAPSPSQAGIAALSAVIEDVQARRTADGRSFDEARGDSGSPRSGRSPALYLDLPRPPGHSEAAFTAMQYLPMPIVVLGPLKTVVLANDAMGRLLDVDLAHGTAVPTRGVQAYAAISESMHGQTLSQIGVDALAQGDPIFMNWDRFLDSIGQGLTSSGPGTPRGRDMPEDDSDAGERTPTGEPLPMLTTANLNRQTVHDVAVDVIISAQHNRQRSKAGVAQLTANMIITAWTMDEVKYWTLMFTASAQEISPEPPKEPIRDQTNSVKGINQSTRSVHKPSLAYTNSSGSVSSTSSTGRRHHGHSTPSSVVSSPSIHPPVFPPNGPPPRSALSFTTTTLQKTTRLRDALVNAMDLPCYAVWRDMSVGIPNKALLRLATGEDVATTEEEFMRHFICWTEDFSRQLDVEEYPIIMLVRAQSKLQSRRLGIYDPKTGQPRVFDTTGEAIYDDHTGEFLGGVVVLKDVTEYIDRIAAQKKLTARQFEYIAEMIPQLVWTSSFKGSLDWFSQRWYDYTGMTEDASINDGWVASLHPEDAPLTIKKWMHAMASGEPYTAEMRLERRDGSYRWFLGQALPLRDERNTIVRWFGTYTDINEVVEAREVAKQTREQLRRVIETAEVTLWSVDSNRTITMMEGSLTFLNSVQTGSLDEHNIIGMNMYSVLAMFIPPHTLVQYRMPIEDVLTGRSADETREYETDGRVYRTRYVPLLRSTRTAGQEGEAFVDGVIGVTIDVTELRRREKELQVQEKENSKLLANALAAKEASKMKSQFLANMSHEIRTPIGGVLGMTELILDTTLDEEQRGFAENIQRSANGLLTVINDILDLSKVESGRLDIEEVQFSLSVVIQDVNKMLSFAAERKGLAYETDVEPAVAQDLRVMGDPGRLRQILTNLLTNSIKFTSEGRVTLKSKVRKQTAENIVVEFSVEDTGIGIEEEVRKKLFKPFSQADSSTARRYGGTGLGLTISKNLVELMHGDVKLSSRIGIGTKATFWIPFKRAEYLGSSASPLVSLASIPDRLQSDASIASSDDRRTPPLTPAGSFSNPSKKGIAGLAGSLAELAEGVDGLTEAEKKAVQVLVVEDNPINQQIALRTIKKLGFSVSAVWNGQECLDYLQNESLPQPHIILMDVQMPIMDGYRATYTIRNKAPFTQSSRLRTTPIVAMTASAIQGDREKCQRAGMDDYLAKPVKGKVLEKMLLKWAIESKKKTFEAVVGGSDPAADMSRSSVSDTLSEAGLDGASPPLVGHGHTLGFAAEPPGSLSRTTSDDVRLATVVAKSVETEDARTMRRAEAEEKAMALRDANLRSVAGGSAGATASGPTHALTHENMDKFEHAQEMLGEAEATGTVADLIGDAHADAGATASANAEVDADADAASRAETSSSLHVNGRESVSVSVSGASSPRPSSSLSQLPLLAGSNGLRALRVVLPRHDSERTVTMPRRGES